MRRDTDLGTRIADLAARVLLRYFQCPPRIFARVWRPMLRGCSWRVAIDRSASQFERSLITGRSGRTPCLRATSSRPRIVGAPAYGGESVDDRRVGTVCAGTNARSGRTGQFGTSHDPDLARERQQGAIANLTGEHSGLFFGYRGALVPL
jgi:hypothetical protein